MASIQPLPRIPHADEIIPAMQRILSSFSSLQNTIVQTITPSTATFENVVRPWADLDNATNGELGVIWMLQYGAPDSSVQETVLKARKLFIEAEGAWYSREGYYRLLAAVKNREAGTLDVESKHLLDDMLLEYRFCGCGVLDDAQKKRFVQQTLEIDNLRMEFQKNIGREKGGLWFTLEELQGVSANDLARWKDGDKGSPEQGQKFVPFANGGTTTILTHAHLVETRKKMFIADQAKLGVNVPILEEIVQKRHAQSAMIGYASWAEYRMERRMSKSVQWVEKFLQDLSAGLVPLGRNELQLLQEVRRRDRHDTPSDKRLIETAGFPPWDMKYYQNLGEKGYEVDHSVISEYFTVDAVPQAMLLVFSKLAGLRFAPMNKTVDSGQIWHDSVQVFSAVDESGELVGYLYFDLIFREYKYRGNHNVTMECGYSKPDGNRHLPTTILMCSFPTSTPEKPALLQHSNVVSLFHELGHAVHNLVSKTKYAQFHGVRMPPDFSEMPSVFLENWCWMPDVLQELSCHYTFLDPKYLIKWRSDHPSSPDPPMHIPDELVRSLVERRYANRGLYHLFQLSTSLFDLKIHNLRSEHDLKALDIRKIWYDLREDVEGLDLGLCRLDGSHMVSMAHLTAGLDMGYYAYLLCYTLAEDLFQTAFAKDPHDHNAWDRYKRQILEVGGSPPDMLAVLADFLGHPPDPSALVRRLGTERKC